MAGSGKSTLGKKLARQLSIAFCDLDDEIEKEQNRSIQQIFDSDGESFFRKIEKNKLNGLSYLATPMLISTGGGTPCFHDNMKFMNEVGMTVFIDVPIVEIANRLASAPLENRPLFRGLTNVELSEKLTVQHKERKVYYQQAQYTFNENSSVAEIVKIL